MFNFGMFKNPLRVAAILFLLASEQGFIGIAVYFACWVFMFPVMVVICIGAGWFGWFFDMAVDKQYAEMAEIHAKNLPRDEAQE